ncbi:MAG: hypothetical protein ABR591_02585 [Candidatus Velthaea sp.]
MHSAVAPADGAEAGERFERALEAAVRRYDGPAPVAAMIHYHFGYDAGAGDRPARERRHAGLVLRAAEQHGATFEDGYRATELCDAILRSARCGRGEDVSYRGPA